jgi:hypothetical protein
MPQSGILGVRVEFGFGEHTVMTQALTTLSQTLRLRIDNGNENCCANDDTDHNVFANALSPLWFEMEGAPGDSTNYVGNGLANCVGSSVENAHGAERAA